MLWDPSFRHYHVKPSQYDVRATFDFLHGLRPALLVLDVIYLLFVVKIAPRLRGFRTDPRLLRDLSIIWNSFNALTSMYMSVLLLPELLHSLGKGWYHTTCRVGTFYSSPWSGHAMYMFCLSKIWELGDTVLLALRGRKPIFLHYFHHSAVLVQVVFTYYSAGAMARLGTDMNSFVHSLMYSYFAAVNVFPSLRRYAPIITCLQMAQFVVACVGMAFVVGYILAGRECEVDKMMLPMHFAIYAVFFYLFARFFLESRNQRRNKAHTAGGDDKNSLRSSSAKLHLQ